jgi:hypothetical protein
VESKEEDIEEEEKEEIKPLVKQIKPAESDEDEITETSEIIEYQTTLNGTIKNIQSIQIRANSKSPPPPPLSLVQQFEAELAGVFHTAATTPQPKVPPRIKKKYTKKSHTEQLSRYILPLARKLSDADSLENDSIEEPPESPETEMGKGSF